MITDVMKPVDPELTKSLVESKRRETTEVGGLLSQQQRSRERESARLHDQWDALGVGPDATMQPWNAEEQWNKVRTDPIASMSSPLALLTIAASTFTRQGFINSLNGLAAMQNAINKGDTASYLQNHEAWKENTELAIKRHTMAQRDFELALRLRDSDVAAGDAQVKAVMTKYGMDREATMWEHGMIPEVLKVQEASRKSVTELIKGYADYMNKQSEVLKRMQDTKHQQIMEKIDQQKANTEEEKARIEKQKADEQERYHREQQEGLNKWREDQAKIQRERIQAGDKKAQDKQAAAAKDRKKFVDDYQQTLKRAGEQADALAEHWLPTVGAMGTLGAIEETIEGWGAGLVGATPNTEIRDFQRTLAQLKEDYGQTFQRKGRNLSAEFAQLETIIPGSISMGKLGVGGVELPRFTRIIDVQHALHDMQEKMKARYDDLIKPDEPDSPKPPEGYPNAIQTPDGSWAVPDPNSATGWSKLVPVE